MNQYPPGFEEREDLRSTFIRDITMRQLRDTTELIECCHAESAPIPRKLVRYWHDPSDTPEDVRICLKSWDRLADEGFEFYMFDDASAAAYIA